jgi:hypothetical protein
MLEETPQWMAGIIRDGAGLDIAGQVSFNPDPFLFPSDTITSDPLLLSLRGQSNTPNF